MKILRSSAWMLACLGLVLPMGAHDASAVPSKKKVLIYPTKGETISQLKNQGFDRVIDYGTYWVVEATDAQVDYLKGHHGRRAQKADHLNKIELGATTIDTSVGEPAIPARMKESIQAFRNLRLIQFVGPVRPEWVDAIKTNADIRIVRYVPNNAYLVQVDDQGERFLSQFMGTTGFIQWKGAYHPHYKCKPGLLNTPLETVVVRVGVINGPDADATIASLRQFNVGTNAAPQVVLGEVDVQLTIRGGDLAAIAHMPDVLWVAPVLPFVTHEEKACLIDATQTNQMPGYAPVSITLGGLRYLDFLTNTVGFSTYPGDYPVLDITDTGLDNGSTAPYHPAFYEGPSLDVYEFIRQRDPRGCPTITDRPLAPSRVVYNEHADSSAVSGGHGTYVASLAVGYDDNTNFTETVSYTERGLNLDTQLGCGAGNPPARVCLECCDTYLSAHVVARRDADGFQYGIGVSPFGPFGASWGPAVSPQINPGPSSNGYYNPCDLPQTPPNYHPPVLAGGNAAFNPYEHAARIYLAGHSARICNNSWGEPLVRSADCTTYQNDGYYGVSSRDYDVLTRDAVATATGNPPGPSPLNQEMIYVFAAGDSNGTAPTGGFGDALVTPPGTAKNVITVGATENVRANCSGLPASFSDNSLEISLLTSYGPTSDGRFKPEIVAPGNSVVGALTQYPFRYVWGCDPVPGSPNQTTPEFPCPAVCGYPQCGDDACGFIFDPVKVQPIDALYRCGWGTSAAAPQVSGSIQLLWWYFQNILLNEQNQHLLQPSPAMARAYLVNSARYLPFTNPITGVKDKLPSMAQGMGMLDLQRMFDGVPRVLRDETSKRAVDSPMSTTNVIAQQTFFSRSGQSYSVGGQIADPTKPFRVTLAWTDAPGTPGDGKQLVNDLDLTVVIGGKTYYGNWFYREYSSASSDQVHDNLNNLESVFLPAGQTGTWQVVVNAFNIAGKGVPNVEGTNLGQDYALVVYNGKSPTDAPVSTINNSMQTAVSIDTYPFAWTNAVNPTLYHKVFPSPSATMTGPEAFFKIVNPTKGVTITADTFGSDFDTVVSVWKGVSGTLLEVASNDNSSNTFQSAVSWTVDETTTYYILVSGIQYPAGQSAQGTAVLNVNVSPVPITFNPTPVDFGQAMVGQTSAVVVVNLSNGTSENLTVNSISIEGDDAANFYLRSGCVNSTLHPGGVCPLQLQFIPQFPAGLKTNATLVVMDTAIGHRRTLPLRGESLVPAAVGCSTGGSLTFGTLAVGLQTTNQNFRLTNCGTAPMVFTNYTITGTAVADFAVVSNSYTTPVVPGDIIDFGVQFAPTTSGVRTATLQISDSATNSPQLVTLVGNGFMPTPLVCLSTTNLDLGPIAVGSTGNVATVTLTNCGLLPLHIVSVTTTGTNATDFLVQSDCSTVEPGSNCAVTVRFAPTASGQEAAVVTLVDDAPGSPHLISLTGFGSTSAADLGISKKPNAKKFIGLGTINSTGTGQTITQRVNKGKKKVFYVAVKNTGTNPDTFHILGTGSVPGATVQYFLGYFKGKNNAKTSLVDITGAVTNTTAAAAGYQTATLAPGAITGDATWILMQVTADKLAPPATNTFSVTGYSTTNPTKSDTVKAVAITK